MKSSPHKDYSKKGGIDILLCKILIWEPEDKSRIDVTCPDDSKCLVIRECESVEIEESYKKLIGTASVKFPRGTMIRRTLTKERLDENGADTVYVERLADGVLAERRSGSTVAAPSDFSVGQRIRIYLSYYKEDGKYVGDDEAVKEKMEKELLDGGPIFDGYIVKCSASTPIELKCENLASGLKRKNCRKLTTGNNAKVNDFIKEGGKYYLLGGTGLKPHPYTASCDINIGKVQLSDELTVADLLTEWSKYKLYCFLCPGEDDSVSLKVGRSYFSSKTAESLLNDTDDKKPRVIQFDYHVASDDLTLLNTDPQFLAVSAEGFRFEGSGAGQKEVKISVTVRLNPEWKGPGDTKHKKFQLLNATKLGKKSQKLGIVQKSGANIDLSQYNVVSYTASKIGITQDELAEEAEACFESYNMNGIEGSVTIFGDKPLVRTATKVELIDLRQPEKNGWYLVEEVNTKFGVSGFRQTIKMPYCVARAEREER